MSSDVDPMSSDTAGSDETERVSFVVRMDFLVTDADVFIASARAEAEAAAEPGERVVVETVDDAMFSYASIAGLDGLIESAPGLEIQVLASEVLRDLDEIEIEPDS